MENASKALLIAGGVLLAMMIISVMLYMSTKITEMGEAQNNRKAAEQLAAFNAEYEAYNKKLLYGTDVISVINKAMEYNNTLDPANQSDVDKFINVKVELTQEFKGILVEVTNKEGLKSKYVINSAPMLSVGTHNLITRNASSVNTNSDLKNFCMQDLTYKEPEIKRDEDSIDGTGTKVSQIEYSALIEFKRTVFECTTATPSTDSPVKYNNEGKINEICFVQHSGATF